MNRGPVGPAEFSARPVAVGQALALVPTLAMPGTHTQPVRLALKSQSCRRFYGAPLVRVAYVLRLINLTKFLRQCFTAMPVKPALARDVMRSPL